MHGPLDRRVRWVHVSEVGDMSNLLEGGELVLTTGLALLDQQHRDAYLPGLAAAGAAGVIIELGMHIDELPESVLASGVSLGLPVIVLHRRVRFVDVTEEVHRRIVAEQYAEVDYARRVHETFTALSMRRASLNEIVEVAAAMLGSALVLEDLNRQVLAYARAWHADHGTARRLGPPVPANAVRRARRLADPPGRPVPARMGPVDRALRGAPPIAP